MSTIESRIAKAQAAVRSAGIELPGGNLLEKRKFEAGMEIRASESDDSWEFVGHAAVFDELSEVLGMFFPFREKIQRGAFKRVLGDDVRFLINHDGIPLARTRGGTLRLKEDPRGLAVEADIAPTQDGKDLKISLERKDVDQMSFMFTVAEAEWDEDTDDGMPVRIIKRIEALYDVSVVTFPAYPQTDAGARGGDQELEGRSAVELHELAWRIHRGDDEATAEQRSQIEQLLHNFSTVSPWEAERTLRAVAAEPELMAAIPGQRAHVELTPTEGESPAFRRAAAERRLRSREHLVRS